jgi:hypothetical protein
VERTWRGRSQNDESTRERLVILEGKTGAKLREETEETAGEESSDGEM